MYSVNNRKKNNRKNVALIMALLLIILIGICIILNKAFLARADTIDVSLENDRISAEIKAASFPSIRAWKWEIHYYKGTECIYSEKISINNDSIKWPINTDIAADTFVVAAEPVFFGRRIESPANKISFRSAMICKNWERYLFEHLQKDIKTLQEKYRCEVNILGSSFQDRPIYIIKKGNGGKCVLVTAGTHARENANTPLVMNGLLDLLESDYEIPEDISLLVIPLVNPDGYMHCIDNSDGKLKCNMNGVDINRNFPCKYWGMDDNKNPGENGYAGMEPGSERETKAVMSAFENYNIVLTVDVHSRGREIIAGKGGYEEADIKNGIPPHELNRMANEIAVNLHKRMDGLYDLIEENYVAPGEEGTLTDYAFTQGSVALTLETLPKGSELPADVKAIQAEYDACNMPSLIIGAMEYASDNIKNTQAY